jgi:cytochrome P450
MDGTGIETMSNDIHTGCPVHSNNGEPLASFDFFDPATIEQPYDFYRAARSEAPVYRLPDTDIFFVSRYADVRQALKRTDVFSNRITDKLNVPLKSKEAAKIYEQGWEPADTLLTLDPPRHKVYRSLLNRVFSKKRVAGMHDYMVQITNEIIDGWIDDGEVDLLNDFCVPFPIWVIADQLGVPRQDMTLFKHWSDCFASRLSGFADEEKEVEDAQAILAFQRYFVSKIDQLRAVPQDNIISDLAQARIDDDRLLTHEELLSIIQQLLVAGNETSRATIAAGVLYLIQNPDQFQCLREDPSLITNAVEEILRLATPSCGLWRVVTADTQLAGVDIPKGAMLMVRFASANRDEAVFEQPELMDVCRHNASDNLAFGQGVHFCLGAQLARKEVQVALEHLLARTDKWRLTPGKNNLRHWPNMILRGLEELHIGFDKRAP